jgi:hypothetical protein
MTFAEYIRLLGNLTQSPLEAYTPLLVLVLPGWLFWRLLFRPLVLKGSPMMLTLGGAALLLVCSHLWNSGMYIGTLLLSPLVFLVGREAYRRLISTF